MLIFQEEKKQLGTPSSGDLVGLLIKLKLSFVFDQRVLNYSETKNVIGLSS